VKSSKEDLRKRGFINTEDIKKYEQCTNQELIKLVNSPNAVERSAAINILSIRGDIRDIEFTKILLNRLCIERSLYTKLEICNALEKGNIETAKEMIHYLGVIGKNQYKCLPNKVSKKNSYPLPRDIIARTLGKMECIIIPVLFEVLDSDEEKKITEVIDAIGFMLFYNQQYNNEKYFIAITDTMNKYLGNDIIIWKCVLCLSSFWTQDSIEILNKIINSDKEEIIKWEAKRSLKIVNTKINR
jgi:hypothetical protein